MEQYQVSARKYRPSRFEDVVGQDAVTTTLDNAIKQEHIAHAYLFCGPRGVGKTTCARIFAKQVNFDSGKNADSNYDFNIFELDAASNNSVEDIRGLIDQVRVPPQTGNYKVYIIDEVHMLSSAAFNAFLKTLEEPPKHAIFILATTEKYKILPTILSRCQIFDFNRISVEDIEKHLKEIAIKENISTDDEALNIIAIKADGALRDALSLFDQLVSFSGNQLTYKSVIENLSILDYEYYFNITSLIIQGNIGETLILFNDILKRGFDGHHLINGLADHFRSLLVSKSPGTRLLLEVTDSVKQKYIEQSSKCSENFILRCLEITAETDTQYRNSKNQRLLVELSLIKLCSLEIGEQKKTPEIPDNFDKRNESGPGIGNKLLQDNEENTYKTDDPKQIPAARQETVDKHLRPAQKSGKNEEVTQESLSKEPGNKEFHGTQMVKTRPSTLSISQYLSETAVEETVEGDETSSHHQQKKLNETFTLQQLLNAWKECTELYKEKNNIFITLKRREPILRDDNEIEFIVDNAAQDEAIRSEKLEILEFLRNKLQNDHISLTVSVTQKTDAPLLYTGKEKFQRLAEKNPAVLSLAEKLNLDIEY